MTATNPVIVSATPLATADSSPPLSRAGIFLFYYFLHLFLIMIPTSLFLVFFLVILPRFKEVFKDFKTALPAITEWTLAFADFMRSGFFIPFIVIALLFPLFPAWLASRQQNRASRAVWAFFIFNIFFFLTLLGTALAALVLFLPLAKLVQSVSGGDSGGPGL